MATAPKYQAYDLNEIYPELGEYSFKVVLNPRFFKTGQDFEVALVDSDRKPMKFCVKKWGRKLNVSFVIDLDTSDGVSAVSIARGSSEVGRLYFWVIKPG